MSTKDNDFDYNSIGKELEDSPNYNYGTSP